MDLSHLMYRLSQFSVSFGNVIGGRGVDHWGHSLNDPIEGIVEYKNWAKTARYISNTIWGTGPTILQSHTDNKRIMASMLVLPPFIREYERWSRWSLVTIGLGLFYFLFIVFSLKSINGLLIPKYAT